jgi:hypothetical protein
VLFGNAAALAHIHKNKIMGIFSLLCTFGRDQVKIQRYMTNRFLLNKVIFWSYPMTLHRIYSMYPLKTSLYFLSNIYKYRLILKYAMLLYVTLYLH